MKIFGLEQKLLSLSSVHYYIPVTDQVDQVKES